MVQFDDKRGTLPRLDMSGIQPKGWSAARNQNTGAAWLSSARVVRRRVKSFNERNPCLVLHCSRETAWVTRRKVGTTSSQHGPYALGYTRATMEPTTGRQVARRSKSLKWPLSSDCRLQLACMKLESLVTVDQPRHGEYVLGFCTHRPSRQESWQYPNSQSGKKVVPMIGTKS